MQVHKYEKRFSFAATLTFFNFMFNSLIILTFINTGCYYIYKKVPIEMKVYVYVIVDTGLMQSNIICVVFLLLDIYQSN